MKLKSKKTRAQNLIQCEFNARKVREQEGCKKRIKLTVKDGDARGKELDAILIAKTDQRLQELLALPQIDDEIEQDDPR